MNGLARLRAMGAKRQDGHSPIRCYGKSISALPPIVLQNSR